MKRTHPQKTNKNKKSVFGGGGGCKQLLVGCLVAPCSLLAAEESESRAGVEGMDEHLHVTVDADSKVAQARVVVENLDALRVRVVAHRKRLLQARSKLPAKTRKKIPKEFVKERGGRKKSKDKQANSHNSGLQPELKRT